MLWKELQNKLKEIKNHLDEFRELDRSQLTMSKEYNCCRDIVLSTRSCFTAFIDCYAWKISEVEEKKDLIDDYFLVLKQAYYFLLSSDLLNLDFDDLHKKDIDRFINSVDEKTTMSRRLLNGEPASEVLAF